jgi:hypothetical protein
MRQLFELLSIMDIAGSGWNLFQFVRKDPTFWKVNSWTFLSSYDETIDSGWDAASVEKFLKANGIKCWGGQVIEGNYVLNVSRKDAKKAERLLLGDGVPLSSKFGSAPPEYSTCARCGVPTNYRNFFGRWLCDDCR